MLSRISRAANTSIFRGFSTSTRKLISVGDKIPSIEVMENSPGNLMDLNEEIGDSKAFIIGVPGAFSPACSGSHIPGFLRRLRQFNDKGIQKFYVVSVNDAFVMKAWGDSLTENINSNQIRFFADPFAKFTDAVDMKFDASKFFGNERSKRYVLYVEDGKVSKIFSEPDNTGVDVSASDKVYDAI